MNETKEPVNEARVDVQSRIQKLSQERKDYLAAERRRLAEQGKGDSFDEKVAASIRTQAARKGIEFEKQRQLVCPFYSRRMLITFRTR